MPRLIIKRRREELSGRFDSALDLRLEGLTKTFPLFTNGSAEPEGLVLFSKLNFLIPSGQITGLVGRTGCGKTTLGKIAAGILRPDGGTVRMGDVDINHLTITERITLRKWLRYVPQNPDAVLSGRVKVKAAIAEARSIGNMPAEKAGEWDRFLESEELLKREWREMHAADLSLGERRRVVNLLALLICPRFLILDEPFNGLHGKPKEKLCQVLTGMAASKGAGILVISHDEDILHNLCARVFELREGKLLTGATHAT